MSRFRIEYVNDRPSEDVQFALEKPGEPLWAVSFVATVPHWCESSRIYGDLFECRLDAIDGDAVPVPCGGNQEGVIIDRLRAYADELMTPSEQQRLRTATFTSMTFAMVQKRSLLWFTAALAERRMRHSESHGP